MEENSNQEFEGNEFMFIYEWVDSVNLSRPKKNIARDFSDGVLVAELIKNYDPKLVELHNYPAAHSTNQKKYNWNTLNHEKINNINIEKVFKKLGLTIKKEEFDDVIACKPLAIENLLKKIYLKVNKIRGDTADSFGSPTGNSPKDQFYRSQIVERDNQIEELRIKLELIDMKLKKSEEDKLFLNSKIREYNDKIKQYGLYV